MLCAQMELPTVHPPYGLLLPVPWMGNAVWSRTRGCSADTFVQCRHAQGRAGCCVCPPQTQGSLQSVCILCPRQRAAPPKEVWEESHTHLKVWDAVSLPQRYLKHI